MSFPDSHLPPSRFLFRCDGNAATGLGHVSRCMALAEALSELGAEAVFAGDYAEAAQALLHGGGFPILAARPLAEQDDASETLRFATQIESNAIVMDSYAISAEHAAEAQRQTAGVVMIDDFAALPSYTCAAILNFTVNAPHLNYPDGCEHLLGPGYLLVRRRLRDLRARRKYRDGEVRRVLVAIGGTDRHQLTRRIVEALAKVMPHVVVRLAARAESGDWFAGFGPGSGLVPPGQDLADEFAAADVCISGGGLTKYESAYLGVPGAVLSQTPEQAGETEYFAERGLTFDLGLGTALSSRELVERLTIFLTDGPMRDALAEAGRAAFPDDPTRHAAEAIVECLQQRAA